MTLKENEIENLKKFKTASDEQSALINKLQLEKQDHQLEKQKLFSDLSDLKAAKMKANQLADEVEILTDRIEEGINFIIT